MKNTQKEENGNLKNRITLVTWEANHDIPENKIKIILSRLPNSKGGTLHAHCQSLKGRRKERTPETENRGLAMVCGTKLDKSHGVILKSCKKAEFLHNQYEFEATLDWENPPAFPLWWNCLDIFNQEDWDKTGPKAYLLKNPGGCNMINQILMAGKEENLPEGTITLVWSAAKKAERDAIESLWWSKPRPEKDTGPSGKTFGEFKYCQLPFERSHFQESPRLFPQLTRDASTRRMYETQGSLTEKRLLIAECLEWKKIQGTSFLAAAGHIGRVIGDDGYQALTFEDQLRLMLELPPEILEAAWQQIIKKESNNSLRPYCLPQLLILKNKHHHKLWDARLESMNTIELKKNYKEGNNPPLRKKELEWFSLKQEDPKKAWILLQALTFKKEMLDCEGVIPENWKTPLFLEHILSQKHYSMLPSVPAPWVTIAMATLKNRRKPKPSPEVVKCIREMEANISKII